MHTAIVIGRNGRNDWIGMAASETGPAWIATRRRPLHSDRPPTADAPTSLACDKGNAAAPSRGTDTVYADSRGTILDPACRRLRTLPFRESSALTVDRPFSGGDGDSLHKFLVHFGGM
jgi:hypothetical protein